MRSITSNGMANDNRGRMNLPASKLPHEEVPKGDFRGSLHWRVLRIMSELIEGWQFLADFKKTVTVFGSTRFIEGDKWYEEARKFGGLVAKDGLGIVTGGGPGIMEAANRGAYEADGESVGINIQLMEDQRINPYVKKSRAFHYFFVRKVMLAYAARAYVFFPGGFGTLDEVFEILTLIQTKKISGKIPVILVGEEYWSTIHRWLDEDIYQKLKAVDKEDLSIYTIVDSAEEAFEIVKNAPPREDFYY